MPNLIRDNDSIYVFSDDTTTCDICDALTARDWNEEFGGVICEDCIEGNKK